MTARLLCVECEQMDYNPATPPTEPSSQAGPSTLPTEQLGRHTMFDLNQLPPDEEDMEIIVISGVEADSKEDMEIIVISDDEAGSDGMDD